MDAKKLAEHLNGIGYGDITLTHQDAAKENGLVIVYGASDDLMEFRGAIDEELDAYNGRVAYLNRDNLMLNECEEIGCPYYMQKAKEAIEEGRVIIALWGQNGYSWTYQTDIPHETFDIMDDGDKYCRGIVFSISEIPGGAAQ